jgi:hypothetical protein
MPRRWTTTTGFAALVLGALAASESMAAGRCPPAAALATQLPLGVDLAGAGWVTACRPDAGGALLLAALLPPEGRPEPPELVVWLGRFGKAGGEGKRASLKVASTDEPRLREVTPAAESWTARVERSRVGGENLVQVTLTASWGGNLLYTQDVVALLRETGDGLQPLWTGLGSWTENRFDICLLSGQASFRVQDGRLERLTRVARRRGRAPITEEPARQVHKECLPQAPQRQSFAWPAPPAAAR